MAASSIEELAKFDRRSLSLPQSVREAGGLVQWNLATRETQRLWELLDRMCAPASVGDALADVGGIVGMGHNLWAYAYMRMLYHKAPNLYYAVLRASPEMLLPIVYTPTVGEACQKFGRLPFFPRGCYVSVHADRGNFAAVLRDYAAAHLERRADGTYDCECVVFSDGGRILGLGDLGAWGMGIPIGKLDLYTVCAGVNPHKTVPVILDAGIHGPRGNTAGLDIGGDARYTGARAARETETSAAGTMVNSCYFDGGDNAVDEFMRAATEVFGERVLLQFEDFNSNDAFPLLARQRAKFLTYNDDIQGTAGVAVAGMLGAVRLKHPEATDLTARLRDQVFLLHGAGSANLGAASLLHHEGGVPKDRIFLTNSKGLIWRSADGASGTFRNEEQKEFAQVGRPAFPHEALLDVIANVRPSVLVGAVGVQPGCFNEAVVKLMVEIADARATRPVIFALSNPKTQAELSSSDCYAWSGGRAIYGSGTGMPPVQIGGRQQVLAQVNNIYIFPGMSFAAVRCGATAIPDRLFLVAAEAVARSLSPEEIAGDRVLPGLGRIGEVSLNVAAAVALACQRDGLARTALGATEAEVKAALAAARWNPTLTDAESSLVGSAGAPAAMARLPRPKM